MVCSSAVCVHQDNLVTPSMLETVRSVPLASTKKMKGLMFVLLVVLASRHQPLARYTVQIVKLASTNRRQVN